MVINDLTATGPVANERVPVATFDSTGTIRIGRDPDNDVVLADFWVSRKHAEVRHRGSRYHLVDLNSSNGLHVNGRRVPKAVLAPGDRFTIGRHEFLFDGTQIYQHDDQGPTSIISDDITVEIKKSLLLDDISFALRHGTLLGIVGPSGCGKSTLLRAMTGFRPPSRGAMMYDGKDLYDHYSELRYRIGMVPQDDVLHRQLTVRRALRFAAALRFSDDVPRRQRKRRVSDVLELLGLTRRAKQRIDTLSGGQRKRTSVALELLTEPSLLALDEPTSGLDPALDKEVMRELRLLADRGRTVVVVTHSVLHLDLCDHVLVMCLGGRMGYFGPPDELLGFFEAEDYADVFDKVTNDPQRWAQRYRNSDVYRRYVGEVALELTRPDSPAVAAFAMPTPRAPANAASASAASAPAATPASSPVVPTPAAPAPAAPTPAAPAPAAPTPAAPAAADGPPAKAAPRSPAKRPAKSPSKVVSGIDRVAAVVFRDSKPASSELPRGVQEKSVAQRALHPMAPLRQFFTLCLRMIAVIVADRGYAAFLIGLPLALGLLSYTVPGEKGLGPDPEGFSLEAQRLLIVFVIGAAFMGLAISIREIVSESSIYRRERAIGLSPTAYLMSKLLIFVIIDVIQVVLFIYISLWRRTGPVEAMVLPDPTVEVMLAVTLVAISSTTIGLLAGALVRTTEQTTPILVVTVMTQLVLSGGLFQISGQGRVLEIVSWVDPSRWGFAAAASTTNLSSLPPSFFDPLWGHTAGNWWRAIAVLLAQIVIVVIATRIALRRFEPGRS